ncbi:MAG: Undecaprenyl-phosphate 4-deoxy-4-formamido-L-arabinose transferase [Parcubacteria group bacterium ADurb.Bin326]|nr:MAG: Undecaprenyl-phosphate 4-deoxy-4-formamido-L-arabinose transferase [Parcubacteria group bacterium ADurb.Bin326]
MNSNNCSVSIVIPVYNEQKILRRQIEHIIKELRSRSKFKYEIILVANGCTDNTFRICKDLNRYKAVRTIFLDKADYGYALRAGMSSAIGKMIVNFDIDFYDINFLFQALALEPFGYDIIVASKNIKLSSDNRKLIRRVISGLYKYVLYYGFGLQVSDTHGIKAWRNDKKLRKLIDKTVNNKEIFDTELIIRSQYAGRKLLELPTNVKEIRKSVSSIFKRALRGSLQIFKLWLSIKIFEKR